MHVQTKTIIPPSLYYELLYYENESPYKFVILIYQLINLPLKLYEEFVARYSQILFDPGRKKFPTNRFTLCKRASRGRRAQGRKEGGRKEKEQWRGERERERERRKKGRRATRERRAAIETTGEPQVAI